MVTIIGGIVFFYSIIAYRGWHPTGESIFLGGLGNLLLGIGIWFGINDLLDKKFSDWLPDEDNSYAEWKERGRLMERWIRIAGAAAFLLSAWYLSYLMGGGSYQGGWYYNYASGYMLVISVLLQFILAETAMQREGIALVENDMDIDMAVVQYAAYLFRKRAGNETAMPRFLRWRLNNILFSQKGKTNGGNV